MHWKLPSKIRYYFSNCNLLIITRNKYSYLFHISSSLSTIIIQYFLNFFNIKIEACKTSSYFFIKLINSSSIAFSSSCVLPSNLTVILGPVLEALTRAHPLSNSALTPSISFMLYPFSIQ